MKTLLIETNPAIAALVKQTLELQAATAATEIVAELIWFSDLDTAETQLKQLLSAPAGMDVSLALESLPPTSYWTCIVLGLNHHADHDAANMARLNLLAPTCPIVLLGDGDTLEAEEDALELSGEAYLARTQIHSRLLPSLQQACRLKRARLEIRYLHERLREEQQSLQTLMATTNDGVIQVDDQGGITHMNHVAEKYTGWELSEALHEPLSRIFTVLDENAHTHCPYNRLVHANQTLHFNPDALLINRQGKEIAIASSMTHLRTPMGNSRGGLLVFHDTAQTHGLALKMAHLAQHDPLTDLPNRNLLHDRLSQALTLAIRHQRQLAVLYMDLDHFKNINDNLGHAIGDKLLQVVADRLLGCVRYSDLVSRQGGDEFIILLTEIEHADAALHCAEKIQASLATPMAIDSHQLYISLSIGISLFPDDGNDLQSLIRNADTAMYHAKTHGRNNIQFFHQAMNDQRHQRQALELDLRQALQEQQFILHYQPTIALDDGSISGVEALIRWNHPEQGLISPGHFVNVAEECGLMHNIDHWVLRQACQQMQTWRKAGLALDKLSVNISSSEFQHPDFIAEVRHILETTHLPAECLELEFTEGTLMSHLETTQARLQELKQLGLCIAIDDFGTGYSNLAYLKRFPVDTLKIDRSFIQTMTHDPADAAIVSSLIGMGKNLNYRIVAEGVETREQHLFLQAHHCDESQGHHFSRPLNAAAFASLMGEQLQSLH